VGTQPQIFQRFIPLKNQQIKGDTMTTLLLDDKLLNEVVQISNYQTAQEAVAAILSDYIKTHSAKKNLFDKLHLDIDMADEEIDSLFERDKETGRTLNL
jgi:hypothetical protein